jgi:chemotaxis protein CheD
VGERNTQATREALASAGIPVVADDTGKDYGRSVYFFLETGRVEVRSYAHGTRIL